jgi:hypothetical protein
MVNVLNVFDSSMWWQFWYKVATDTQPLQYTFLYRFWKEVLNFDSWVSLVKCLSCNVFDVITHGIVFVNLNDYNNNVTILLWFF